MNNENPSSTPGRRTAVVTGGSRGLGREIVSHLARSNFNVVINYRRNQDHALEAVKEVEEHGGKAVAIQADLGDSAAIDRMFDQIAEEFGSVDVLIANAAATAFKPLMDLSIDNVQKTFNLVICGFVQMIQRSVPLMSAGSGRIIGISGIDSFRYMPGHGLLGAAKAAMESLVRSFAVELGSQGITVNAVCPGGFETESSKIWGGSEFEFMKERFTAQSAVKDFGTTMDMANLVDYLVSDGARFLTGQTIVIDGGLTVNLADLDAMNEAERRFDQGFVVS